MDVAGAEKPDEDKAEEKKLEWYQVIKLRGYTQLRYDNIPTPDQNEDLVNAQGDRYIGGDSGFGIRRARVILYGDVHDHLSIYLQTDFASVVDGTLHVANVRDWYADIYLDKKKEFRLRAGQSKVPFGFENMQSSQNRLPLDRNDGLNSALKDERDLGLFAYWAPDHVRKLFKHLVDDNLKGSGDYGVVAAGVYNGQTANKFDFNGNFHVVGRLAYPFEIGSQILEANIGGYTGLYTVNVEDAEDGTTYSVDDSDEDLRDSRGYAALVLYPQPIGFAAEYNIGKGPSQGEGNDTVIDTRALHGGYVQAMFKIDEPFGTVSIIPYVRAQMYQGGKKFETNTPYYDVKELELGVEWQTFKALETTLVYTFADRTSSSYPYNQESGQLCRFQLQFNY